MKVRDVMTSNPVSCNADATLQDVARKMDEIDSGIIPIVENGQLKGVITDRDIAIRAVADGANPSSGKAITYATQDVKSVSPDMDLEDAAEIMEESMIRRLVVVENGKLVGMVSLGDVAECDADEAEDVLIEVSKSEKTLAHKRRD